MDQIIEWKFRLSPLGEINEPGRAIVKTNNKKRLLDISIMIHSPKLSWGGVKKCLKLSRGAEIKIFVSGDKNIWHTRHFGGHVITDTGKNICNSGRSLKLCRKMRQDKQQPAADENRDLFVIFQCLPRLVSCRKHGWPKFTGVFCGKICRAPWCLAAAIVSCKVNEWLHCCGGQSWGHWMERWPAAPALRVIKPSSDSQIQITIIRTISWHGRRYNDIIRRAKVPKQCFPKVREWIWMDVPSHGLVLTTQLEQYQRRYEGIIPTVCWCWY